MTRQKRYTVVALKKRRYCATPNDRRMSIQARAPLHSVLLFLKRNNSPALEGSDLSINVMTQQHVLARSLCCCSCAARSVRRPQALGLSASRLGRDECRAFKSGIAYSIRELSWLSIFNTYMAEHHSIHSYPSQRSNVDACAARTYDGSGTASVRTW